jgi:hypothetical protein
MKRVVLALIAAGALGVGTGALLTGSGFAAASTNGCPSGYQLLSVQ